MRATLLILLSLLMTGVVRAVAAPKPDWDYVEQKLKAARVKSAFVEDLKGLYQKKYFDKVIELNVLLYLKKEDVHGPQATPTAVRDIKKFMRAHKKILLSAEEEYGVDGRVIASLLWLESRYGKNKGKYQVASTYLHLLQADRPDIVAFLKKKSLDYLDRPSSKIRKEIVKRTSQKSKWAIEQIKALAKMHKKDDELLKKLKGSFAGAMGMPQFIPSSYVAYAKAGNSDKSPDLNRAEDAILSVANYLKKSGWKKNREKTYTKALLKYNKSNDYVNTILELAGKIEEGRGLSSDQ